MKHHYFLSGMRAFVLLWATQGLSTLGSSMTSYALVVWAYEQTGSAFSTALLTICLHTAGFYPRLSSYRYDSTLPFNPSLAV